MPNKQYISAQQLLDDSFQLGLNILESGYLPNFIVAIWRGGTPVGIAIQEMLDYFGHPSDHIAIRTALYTGIEQRADKVKVYGLGYVENNIKASDKLLLVDDVYDTGLSMAQVLADIEKHCGDNTPDIKVATPYFKPNNNKTQRKPDYFLHQTDDWLVFPHELAGLEIEEVLAHKPGIETLRAKLQTLR